MRKEFKVLLTVLVFIAGQQIASAQGLRVTTFKLGYFNPKDTKSGFIFGANFGSAIDENVDIGIGIDFFHRNYTEDKKVAERVSPGGVVESTIQRELEFTTTILPIMGTITVKISPEYPFSYYIGGGLGYELLFNKERNYQEGVSESRFYHGFSWLVNGGVLYRIGSRSAFLGEVFYNGATVHRGKGKTTEGLPIWEEVNLSGLGVRFGIRLGFF